MAITKYDLDINKQAIMKPVVILRQGDHDIDTMEVWLSVANEPMDLTGATVKFMGNTANGRKIIDDTNVKITNAKGGVFEYVFPSEASSDIGEYKVAYFSIILANGQSSTMDFRVQVLSGVDLSAPAASDYVSHYDTMVSELNSAYDSATNATNQKMASTVSSLATSAATVLDSALARVNTINSTANNASSAASKAVSMASSVASTVTSQASYINSVASSAASNVSSVAAGVVDKLNNISVGGRNLFLNSKDFNNPSWSFSNDTSKSAMSNGFTKISRTSDGAILAYNKSTGISKENLLTYTPYIWSFFASNTGSTDVTISLNTGAVNNTPSTRVVIPANTSDKRYSFSFSFWTTGGNPDIGLSAVNVTGGEIALYAHKLEKGNVPTDWTPAPEDADNTFLKKANRLPAEARDFAIIASDMTKYQGTWYTDGTAVANGPTDNWNWNSIEVIGGFGNGAGIIRTAGFGYNQEYITTVNSGKIVGWKAVANDANLVHNAGNETVAGDKTLTGNTTLANIKSSNVKTGSVKLGGMTINFRETAVGVNVFMDGSWQGAFSMGDAYVDSGSIPTSISNPRQNIVLNIIGNAGVGGVTTNSPFKLEVLITTDGKVKYRSKNLRDNDTASRTATIVGAASTFYSLD